MRTVIIFFLLGMTVFGHVLTCSNVVDKTIHKDEGPAMDTSEVSEETIIRYAKIYTEAPCVVIDHYMGNYAFVHCYEYVFDGEGEWHTATIDWLRVDCTSGVAYDFEGHEIHLFEI